MTGAPGRLQRHAAVLPRRWRASPRRIGSLCGLVLGLALPSGAAAASGWTTSSAALVSSPHLALPPPRAEFLSNPGPVPRPDQDPFYTVPANIASFPNGAVVDSRSVQAMALAVPIPATGWQVKYKTIDQHDQPSAFVTTVLVPLSPWVGGGPRPLISYQAAVDALSTKCAPSFIMRAGTEAGVTGGPTVLGSNAETETANILQAVQQGFAVAVPDWEGPIAEWISASGSARGVLDGIRAAQNFQPDGIIGSTPIGLVGYSGGALATDWAIQMQPTYAPGLHFAGAALGGTPASLPASFADFAANQGGRAAIPLLMAALERSYQGWNVGQYLSTTGQTAVANSQDDCLLDALNRNAGVDPATYEAYPGAIYGDPPNQPFDQELLDISPLGYPGVPTTPILFYHSTNDELAPIGEMQQLAARFCSEGVIVDVETSPAGDHIAYVLAGFPTGLKYLADRFAGVPAPNDCSVPGTNAPEVPAASLIPLLGLSVIGGRTVRARRRRRHRAGSAVSIST